MAGSIVRPCAPCCKACVHDGPAGGHAHLDCRWRDQDDPFSGHVFVFRGRRGNVIKVLWSTGDGLCLLAKRLERGRFVWPQADSGKVHLTAAQLAMLLEGINWKQPERTWPPLSVL